MTHWPHRLSIVLLFGVAMQLLALALVVVVSW